MKTFLQARARIGLALVIQATLLAQPAAEPGSLVNIPGHLNQSLLVIRGMAQASSDPSIQRIRTGLAELTAARASLLSMHRRYVRNRRLPARAALVRGLWTDIDRRTSDWQDSLIRTSGTLEQGSQTLDRETVFFAEALRILAEEQIQQPDLAETITSFQNQIQLARDSGRRAQTVILKLQASLTQVQIDVRTAITDLDEILATERRQIFEIYAPPVWHLRDASGNHTTSNNDAASEAWDPAASKMLLAYFGQRFIERLSFYLICLAPLLLMRKRLYAWLERTGGLQIQTYEIVLRRPYSFAVIPAFLFSPMLEGRADLSSVLLLFPVLRVFPPIFPGDVRRGLWMLAGLTLLYSFVNSFLHDGSIASRIAELIFLFLLGASLYWLQRTLRHRSQPRRRLTQLWIAGSWVALVFAAIALAANVIGALGFSGHVEHGVLMTLTGAVILYGFANITQAFLKLVIEANPNPAAIPANLWDITGVAARLESAVHIVVVISFVWLTLDAFQIQDSVVDYVWTAMARPVALGSISFTLGSIAIIVLCMAVAVFLSRALRFGLEAGVYGRVALARGTGAVISKLVHYTVLTIGFLFAISAAGIDLTKMTLFAGALGVGLGLGLQNIVGNFFSGLIVLFERPLSAGDTVKIGDITGVVTDIGIRATRIHNWDGAEVVVPNSNLLSSFLTNWRGRNDARGVDLTIRVGHDADPAQVLKILQQTALENSYVLKSPPPAARFTAVTVTSFDFVLVFWCKVRDQANASSEIYSTACDRLKEQEVSMPSDIFRNGLPDPKSKVLQKTEPS